jgi:hypothetical protein
MDIVSQEAVRPEENENYVAFVQDVHKWEEKLTAATPDDINQTATEATYELNELWPYPDALCDVSGHAVYPQLDEEGGAQITAGPFETTGFSEGFVVCAFDNERTDYKLYYKFRIGDQEQTPHPTISTVTNFYAFFESTSAAISPLGEIEEGVTGGNWYEPGAYQAVDAEERVATLNQASERLVQLFRSTAFRRASWKHQREDIDGLLSEHEVATRIRELGIAVEADYCCRPSIVDGQIEHEFIPIQNAIVRGVCLGLDTLERVGLSRKAIRRDADLVQRGAGLCLVVDVERTDEPTLLRPTDVILVPLSSQNPEVIFTQEVTPDTLNKYLPDIDSGPGELVG